MNREEIKNLLPVMQAFADGKEIEYCGYGNGAIWLIAEDPDFNFLDYRYRIKPEPKYRPFRNTAECWAEMQKRQPFGWLMHNGCRYQISRIDSAGVFIDGGCENLTFTKYLNDGWTFADGTPFGIKE